jgi:hypothetical protein
MKNNQTGLKSEDIKTDASPVLKRGLSLSISLFSLAFLHRVWQKLVNLLSANTKEPQVWQRVDSYGNTYWEAYDPISRKSFCSGSEADICVWIEQLYKSSKYATTDSSNW